MTPHQFDLLFLLASNAGRFVDRETIALKLRGTTRSIGRSIDVHVYRIRRKLRDERHRRACGSTPSMAAATC